MKRPKTRLALELLEDRIVPSTFSRLPNSDGHAIDSNMDGVFDSVSTNTTVLRSTYYQGVSGQAIENSLIEFYVGDLPANIQINSARLYGNITTLAYLGDGATALFYGYAGNGIVSLADASATSELMGYLTDHTTDGAFYVDLHSYYIQSRIGPGYLGVRIEVPENTFFNISSRENLSTPEIWPTLVIDYTVVANNAPTAVNDSYTATEDSIFVVSAASGVLANDTDPEGSTLQATLVSGPSHGTLTFNSTGSFTYTPQANYNGPDSFTYRAADGQAYSNTATVSLTVNAVDDRPVAANDAYTMGEDTTLTIAAPGLLANDSDVEGATLTASLFSGPVHGSVTLQSDGSFVYTPTAGYYGSDTFTYRAHDGAQYSMAGWVNITIEPSNLAPTANGDVFSLNEDSVLAGSGILDNDTDPDSDALTTILVNGPANGALTFNSDGTFTYTPNANFHGSDSFTYKVNDGEFDSNVATIWLVINSVNDAPVAVNDSYSLNEDTTLTIGLAGVTSLTMVSDPGDYVGQGDTYSFSLSTGTFTANRNYDNGVSLSYDDTNDPGVWWYLNFAAPNNDTITPGFYDNATRWPFQASNVPGLSVYGEGRGSNTLTGEFTVTQAVYAADGSVLRFAASFEQHGEGFTAALRGEIQYNAGNGPSGVLLNDVDADGDALSAILVSGPAHGTLTLNADGTFTYTPFANYSGQDSFTYKTSDGTAQSSVATVTLTINPMNDAPVAVGESFSFAEDSFLSFATPGLLGNDTDADGNTLSAVLASGPSHGSLTLNSNGSFTYTPNANYHGNDSFTYRANDGTTNSNLAVVSLTITPVNDAPTANAGPDAQNGEGGTFTFTGSGADVDGNPLTYTWNFGDGNTATGATVNYAHADQGTYTVTLTVSDGITSATDSMVLTVLNGAPLATLSGPIKGVRGQTQTFTFGAMDPSPVDAAAPFTYTINWGDGSTETATGLSGLERGHVYTTNGSYTVTVRATDKDGAMGATAQYSFAITTAFSLGGDVYVGGTTGIDAISLKVADQSGGVRVTVNGVLEGVFNPTGTIYVYGQAGADNIKFESTKFSGTTRYITDAAFVFGGDGNDTLDLRGSSANNVVVGDAGNDTLYGGLGRDILIGGMGTDVLRAGAGEDLLIGNATIYDGNLAALGALMSEWGRTDQDYSSRAQHLQGDAGGLNGETFLDESTLLEDAVMDTLYGEAGLDLFFSGFSGPRDKVNDLSGGELRIGV